MLIATIPLMFFSDLSEVQRGRADLGNYALNQWVRRRFHNPNNAAIPPASHHPSNTSNVNRLRDRESYLRRRCPPLIHFLAPQATTPFDENAVRNWNRQLLEYSTPEEDLYFRYNIDPDWGASRATPAVRRPHQESTPISHQQPRELTPRRALETRRLPGGIITRHTKVVTIRQSADGPTQFFSPRTGYEPNDTDETRLAAQAESGEDDTKTDEEDEFDPEADDIPSAAAGIAPPKNITDNVSTKQNEEYRVHENTKRGDRSRRVEDLSVEVDRTLNDSPASDVSRGRLR